MRKFILKTLSLLLIVSFLTILGVISMHFKDIKKNGFRNMPLNNTSNSISFRAKLDHIHNSNNFKHCTFLIAGSSMSLNNISGEIIHNRTKECVYNISSWGFKLKEVNKFIVLTNLNNVKYIFLAFNNRDFGNSFTFNSEATDAFLNTNKLRKIQYFISTFNIYLYNKDWESRAKLATINNTYESLNFDTYGSVLFDNKGFVIDENRWNANSDSTGFYIFINQIEKLDSICKKHRIKLLIAYLPTRVDLLTKKNITQNMFISNVLQNKIGKSFVDLQNVRFQNNQYCDGIHLFKKGAEQITNQIIDSLIFRGVVGF